MNEPMLNADAIWKRRFRASVVASTHTAAANSARGLAVSNRSGVYQLYSWDTGTAELRQITNKSAGVTGRSCGLSPIESLAPIT